MTSRVLRSVTSLEAARRVRLHDVVVDLLLRGCPCASQPHEQGEEGGGGDSGSELARSLSGLLGALLNHHVSVSDLRRVLLLLRQAPPVGGSRHAHLGLLEALEWAAVPQHGPSQGPCQYCFNFGGPQARIDLGCVDPFPEDAVTLWMWVRVEPCPQGVPPSMGLLSMTNDTATGLDLSLEASGRQLALRTYSRGSVETGAVGCTLVPGKWHSLAVVFEKRTLLSDRAAVYIDGVAAPVLAAPPPGTKPSGPVPPAEEDGSGGGGGSGPTFLALKYPSSKGLAGGLTHCSIGSASPGRASLQGQLACFAAFACAASTKEVEQLHSATRGPHAALEPALLSVLGASFGSATLQPLLSGPSGPPAGAVPQQQTLLPPRLLSGRRSGLVLCLDPRSADSPDATAVYHVGGADGALQPAQLGPHTSSVRTTSFAEALAALGGPTWLLPLLATPELAADAAAALVRDATPIGTGALQAPTLVGLALPSGGAGLSVLEFATAVSLLAASLEDDANRDAFGATNGLVTLSVLLHACPPQHLSPPLLAAVRRLVASLAPRPDMHAEAASRLLLDLSLWGRQGGAVSLAHLAALTEWLPRSGMQAGGTGPHLTGRHVIRAIAGTPRSQVQYSASAVQLTYRDALLGLLQQLLACDPSATHDILATLTWDEHGAPRSGGGLSPETAMPDECLEDALDALLAVAERQLGAPGGACPPGPCASALVMGGCGMAAAIALLKSGTASPGLRAGALRLAQLSLVATATASGGGGTGDAAGNAPTGAPAAEAASAAAAASQGVPSDAPSGSSAAPSSSLLPSSGAVTPSLLPLEPLCAGPRPDQAAALCSALVEGCAASSDGGVTLALWDALCPVLLEGVAGAPVRPPQGPGDTPSRRQSSNLAANTSASASTSAGASPRSSLDMSDDPRVQGLLLSARLGVAAAGAPGSFRQSVSMLAGPDTFAGGVVPPRGGGCRHPPMGSPPPRRLPGGHTARLAPSAATALVPALVALRHAATPEVRLAAARDCAAVLLTSAPAAAATSRSVLYAQPGWVEAFLSLALWTPPQPRAAWSQQSVSLQAAQLPVAATATSPPETEDTDSAEAAPAADEAAEEQPPAAAAGDDVTAPTPPPPPQPAQPAARQPLELPLAQGPLGAAALALWKDRVIPTPAVMPSPNAPFTEDLAIASLRATGPDPLLAALRAPFATPLRRAALITALSGAFATDGDVLTCVAHDVLVECVAATTASAMCRDAGLPNPSVPGTWAHPLERLRAAIEAAGECARASRTARRDVSRLVLLRTAAHARALLDGGWVSAAQAADGDDAAADPNRDYAPRLSDDAPASSAVSRAPGTALSAAQEGNVRANLLVLGSLCVDELEPVDGILCPPPVDLATDAPSAVALEASLAIATRWIWRASAPPLPRGAGGAAAPPWLDDERSPQCGGAGCKVICAPGRRHHCRMCGGVFCADCSPNKALLPEPPLLQRGNGPHRVCIPCMDAAAPLQGILKTGALMPGALRAAPAYGALRSLVADLADRCACTPGAPPAGPAVAAVSQWLVRAGIVRPDSAADAVPVAMDAAAASAAAAVAPPADAAAPPSAAAPAAAATASDVMSQFLPSGDETTVVMVPQTVVQQQQAAPAPLSGPFILEAEPGDARVSRQQLLRWTLLRLFAVLSETLAARDAAATSGADAAQAARLNNAAMQVCALAARVARATDPLDEGVDDEEAFVVLPDTTGAGGPAGGGDSTSGDASADGSGIPLRLAFQRAFAALSRGDGDVLASATALAGSDTARLLGIPAFGPVRSNAWATAARVARVMRFGRARRLVLEAGTQIEFLDALRSRAAADACVAADAAVATLCRVAAGAAYEEAAMLIGGNTPQAQLTAWRVPGPFAPQRTSLAAAAHTACAARALRRLAFSAGPWALTRAEMREGRAFWRLDWSEDPHRIRRRLKRYAHGSSHVGAAHATTAALMASDAAALSAGEALLAEDTQPLTDDPTSPAAVGGPHHRRQHSLHLVRAVSLTSAARRLSVEDMVPEDEDDPFAVDDEPGDDPDGDGDQGLLMAAVEEDGGDYGDEYEDDGDGEDEEGGEDDQDESPHQHLSFLSPRMSGGSAGAAARTPRMGPPGESPGSEGAPSTGDSSASGPMQRTPIAGDGDGGAVMDDAPPVVITIGGISLTPRPYPTPGPTAKAFSRTAASGDGSQTLDAVDEAADVTIEEEDTEAGSGSEDVSDAALGMHPRRGGHAHRTGASSEPQSAASSAASSGSQAKSRRGLLRRFRAGAKSVADATARVRLATGEAITAIRDDVTAAADAAARVASNTLAMGSLQGLMRSGSIKGGASGGGTGSGMLPGAAGMVGGGGGGGGSLGGGQPAGGVLQPSFVAAAELIRPTRVAPGTVYVTRVAVEWIPAPVAVPAKPPPLSAAPQAADSAATQPGEPQAPPVDGSTQAGAPTADTPAADPGVAAPERSRRWLLSDLVAIYPRRFLLRRRALELFLTSGKSVLLHLPEALAGEGSTAGGEISAADELHRAILNERPPRLVTSPLFAQPLTARRLLRRSRWMARWAAGEMSNLEYLMLLNTAAGRTFNDLQQYPVFPWILADYESPELDLDSPASYRDLTKPVGALNPGRLRAYVDRYEAMAKGDGAMSHGVPPFHYGTHYSSLGSVLFFLLRLAPFTEAALALQEGRLDVADRLFADLGESWRNANTASADVKELIPELFTCPELLRNGAGLPLGSRQDGKPVSDVTLPPWAHGSPERFVRMHRDALESEYVSQRLHHWIDLIFGYKQRGPAAEAAHNLFYFLTYEGAVDVDAITDPMERAAVEAQIALFGQCPGQLFTVPHPQRQPGASRRGNAVSRVPLQMHVRPGARPGPVLRLLPHDPASAPPAALYFHPGEHHGCTLVDADGCIRPLRFGGVVSVSAASGGDDGAAGGAPGGAGEPGDATSDAPSGAAAGGVETLSIALEEKVKRSLLPVVGAPNASSSLQPWKGPQGGTTTISAACAQAVPPYMRAALVPGSGGGVLVAGHWAGLVWLLHPDDPLCGPIQAIQHPASGASMCVAASEDGNVAATGGGDGSLALWRVGLPSSSSQGGAAPWAGATLDGHRGALAGSTAESVRSSSNRRLGRRDKNQCLLDVFSNAGQPAVRCWGHQAALTAVAVSAQLGVCLSGAADGTCLLHALRDGRCIRALRVPPSAHDVDTADALVGTQAETQEEDLCGAVIAVAIGPDGELVIHAAPSPAAGVAGRHLLCVYSLNGRPMGALQLRTPLLAMSVSACGRWLVTANDSAVTVLALHTLEPVAEVTPPRDAGAVTCAALSPCGRALLWGTSEGGVCGSVMDAVLCD